MQAIIRAAAVRAGIAVSLCVCALAGAYAAEPIRIVALGDSNFGAPGVAREQAFPAKLERALRAKGYNIVVVNEGINGDTTMGVMGRLDTAVPQGTHLVLLTIGVNDVLHYKMSREASLANIAKIESRLRERGIEVVRLPTGKRFHGSAAENPDLHVEKYQKAGTSFWHLNAAGYDVAVAEHMPKIEPIVAELSRKGDVSRKSEPGRKRK